MRVLVTTIYKFLTFIDFWKNLGSREERRENIIVGVNKR